jgi:hypothetical protein
VNILEGDGKKVPIRNLHAKSCGNTPNARPNTKTRILFNSKEGFAG